MLERIRRARRVGGDDQPERVDGRVRRDARRTCRGGRHGRRPPSPSGVPALHPGGCRRGAAAHRRGRVRPGGADRERVRRGRPGSRGGRPLARHHVVLLPPGRRRRHHGAARREGVRRRAVGTLPVDHPQALRRATTPAPADRRRPLRVRRARRGAAGDPRGRAGVGRRCPGAGRRPTDPVAHRLDGVRRHRRQPVPDLRPGRELRLHPGPHQARRRSRRAGARPRPRARSRRRDAHHARTTPVRAGRGLAALPGSVLPPRRGGRRGAPRSSDRAGPHEVGRPPTRRQPAGGQRRREGHRERL